MKTAKSYAQNETKCLETRIVFKMSREVLSLALKFIPASSWIVSYHQKPLQTKRPFISVILHLPNHQGANMPGEIVIKNSKTVMQGKVSISYF